MTSRARIVGLCLVAASLCGLPLTSNSTPVEMLLIEADAVRTSDPRKFQQLLTQISAEKHNATPRQLEQLAYLNAWAQAYAGHFDIAAVEAKQLMETTSDVNLRFRAGSLIVNSYGASRQFTEGLRLLEKTLALSSQVKDLELRQSGLGVAAQMYNQVGQYQLSLHYAEQILSAPATSRIRCSVEAVRQEALLNLNLLPADDATIETAVDQCAKQHEYIWGNLIRTTLARKWAAQGNRDRSIALLQEHLPEIEATRYPRLIGEVHSLLGDLLFAKGNIADAEAHARLATENSASIAYSQPLVTAYKTMYDIALQRREPAAALEHYRRYAEADKAYINDVKARELAYQIVRHETLQKTQEIELLNGKNQVLELQQQQEKLSKQNTQLIAALLALLVASIGYWAYKIKRMQVSFRHLAETDALTGISNRHHFTRQAEEALTYCAKTGEDVGLIMFDLDHFKSINDQHGHVAGDCVLKRVAEACRSVCRKNDRFGRVGGEEFALLLVGCDLAAATQMARNCCARIAEICTAECGASFPVTASFGVTTAKQSGYDLTRLMSHADQMLYRSKHDGRNRVSTYDAAVIDRPEAQATQSA